MTRFPLPAARRAGAAIAVLSLALAGCSVTSDEGGDAGSGVVDASVSPTPEHGAADEGGHASGADDSAQPRRPLRSGERFQRLAMPAAYTPSAPYGTGTDDYRCFLLDPGLERDAFITGFDVTPGTKDVVHHVILFRVPPESLERAQAMDREQSGQGWTCFGGTGLEAGVELDDAPWLGAWAPGGGERVMGRDVGVPLESGSQVIMQVHYNLLAGKQPDVTSTRLRLASGKEDLAPLQTMLLPAPVELPCRPERDDSRLCDREAALADLQQRFGAVGQTANYLHLLCDKWPPGPVQRCDRRVDERATIRAVAGHMHLLGKEIRIDVNPGTPRARRVLDIREWNFDDQGSQPIRPTRLRPGDTVRVTCRHDQSMRDLLPAFEGQEERYVMWGEGTTDEMCLGLLLVTRP